ncbi:MAG: hypothetical protein ACLSAO_02395 [Anaerovoracaceae bacterium]
MRASLNNKLFLSKISVYQLYLDDSNLLDKESDVDFAVWILQSGLCLQKYRADAVHCKRIVAIAADEWQICKFLLIG